LLYTLP